MCEATATRSLSNMTGTENLLTAKPCAYGFGIDACDRHGSIRDTRRVVCCNGPVTPPNPPPDLSPLLFIIVIGLKTRHNDKTDNNDDNDQRGDRERSIRNSTKPYRKGDAGDPDPRALSSATALPRESRRNTDREFAPLKAMSLVSLGGRLERRDPRSGSGYAISGTWKYSRKSRK